jgi:hypothetical protein
MTNEAKSDGVARRDVLLGAAGAAAAAVIPASSTGAFAQDSTVSGIVLEDTSGACVRRLNVSGGPRTKVAMTIGGRAPIEMMRRTMPDPFVEEVFARNEATKKPWIKAELSSHMWTARLPGDLPPGTHRVVVEAITEYGDAVSGRIALEVTG